MVQRWFVVCPLILAAAIAAPAPAQAQITRLGETATLMQPPGTMRGTAIAYDSQNDVYLAVGTTGTLRGVFLSPEGVPLGAPFVIQTTANATFYPEVTFSPDANGGAGGFLVAWQEAEGDYATLHGRMVGYTSGMGAESKLGGGEAYWEVSLRAAYATASREFLLVWRTYPPGFGKAQDVRGVRVSNSGAPLGVPFTIGGTTSYEDTPSVAYNPTVDEFMVVFPTITDLPGGGYVSALTGRRIKPTTGSLIGSAVTIAQALAINITDVSYDSITGLYLAVWYQDPPKGLYGRLLNADGSPANAVTPLSLRFAAYDGLGLAHNRTSGTFFAVSHATNLQGGAEDGGVEIDTGGLPLTSGTPITAAGGKATYYPRLAANARSAEWYMVASGNFQRAVGQRFGSAARSGAAPLPPPTAPPPGATTTQMALSHSNLSFGVVAGPAGSPGSGAQTVTVRFTNGSSAWTVASSVPWLTVTPAAGAKGGTFNVSLTPGKWSVGTDIATLSINAPGAVNAPQTIQVTVSTRATATNPFGVIETPVNNATGISGSLPITGWALDDLGVQDVKIWRDPVAGETGAPGNGKVFVGDAVRVDGARPDVDAAYSLPFDNKAGWGFMLLTNMLPNGGNGTFVLHAYATDVDGHTVALGSRTVTCDNNASQNPFGAIDTPAQGETISGSSYNNFGWVLTPQPNRVPFDGSTITVFIDGVPVGHPTYNQSRSDIATLFPGRENSNGAVGFYTIDTTQLTDGVHTIAWSVSDSAGHAVGIGSRYFSVLNGTGAAVSTLTLDRNSSTVELAGGAAELRQAAIAGAEQGRSAATVASLPASEVPLYTRDGYNPSAPLQLVETDAAGIAQIVTGETGRLALTLGPAADAEGDGYEGYLVANGALRALPSGAFLDRRSGDFFWDVGVGFVGSYDLAFVRIDQSVRRVIRVTVRIPK